MTKCPQCGRELSVDDVLISISDNKGRIVDCFHWPKTTWDEFLEMCNKKGVDPSKMFLDMIESFNKYLEGKK